MTRSDNYYDTKYGRWPRRLLHVPTLTSYEWKPGDRYGEHVCPAYNTISYTWGRFALGEGQQPSVQALPIKFEGRRSWKIPRIDPAHFTVDEFRAAVELAAKAYSHGDVYNQGVEDMGVAAKRTVEFLWLDIACIDQEHAKTKMSEINRQAVIFQNARTSCVWLNHLSEDQLSTIVDFSRKVDVAPKDRAENQTIEEAYHVWQAKWFSRVQEITNTILRANEGIDEGICISAPWFSSLWTLQEAYLRPNACALPGNCFGIQLRDSMGILRQMPSLRVVLMGLGRAAWNIEQCLALGVGPRDKMEAFINTIEEAGVRELSQSSPFAVFAASNRRQTSNPRDRVYGIMQIFGAQLPLQRRGKLYEPSELQKILSEKVLLEYPVESQLFVHTELQAPMSKWGIGTSVVMPTWAKGLTTFSRATRGVLNGRHPARPLPLCKFSVTHGSAYFQGRLCSLKDILVPWEKSNTAKLFNGATNKKPHFPPELVSTMLNVDVSFDMVPSTLPGTSRLRVPGIREGFLFASVNCDANDTHKILTELASADTHSDLKLLLLGSCLDPLRTGYKSREGRLYTKFTSAWREKEDEWLIGLILRKTHTPCAPRGSHRATRDEPFMSSYERIGVCKWYKADRWVREDGDENVFTGMESLTDDMKSILSGQGDKWYEAEGYWG
ncbi:uncharacterized protein PG998_010610 [Apiospora kogelbergensis]|uniref:uncharacterized protein n=1 Tax=Apiospora kogelbergensis TaxID=1337665 RepID=UPI00312F36D2